MKKIYSVIYRPCFHDLQRESQEARSRDEELKKLKMVCLVCLVPLFLVPIVNLLPFIFDFLMGKIYRLLGWEYRKPERVPAACPIKPPSNKTDDKVSGEPNPLGPDHPVVHKAVGLDNDKLD